jgi:hypothetical protein
MGAVCSCYYLTAKRTKREGREEKHKRKFLKRSTASKQNLNIHDVPYDGDNELTRSF